MENGKNIKMYAVHKNVIKSFLHVLGMCDNKSVICYNIKSPRNYYIIKQIIKKLKTLLLLKNMSNNSFIKINC